MSQRRGPRDVNRKDIRLEDEHHGDVHPLDAHTSAIALFGHPVEHSISPLFMNAILRRLGFNSIYLAFDIEPAHLEGALGSLRHLRFKGANVTSPFKNAVAPRLDSLEEEAKQIGAVNCIVSRDGALRGYNTDHLGFIGPLKERKVRLRKMPCALLGCGGAARGALYALAREGIGSVYLINRTEEHALDFIRWSKEILGFRDIVYIGNRAAQTGLGAVELVINTTPVGTHPKEGECPLGHAVRFRKGSLIYDLIYNPPETELLKRAKRQGAETLNGLEMLLLQGLHSLALWFPEKKREIWELRGWTIELVQRHLSKLR